MRERERERKIEREREGRETSRLSQTNKQTHGKENKHEAGVERTKVSENEGKRE